jgi:delta-aminolevulinic acid dehydratase/porphobilinogen synthase
MFIERMRTKQKIMKKVRRIFFSDRNNKMKAVRTELIAEVNAILVLPKIVSEGKKLRKKISSIPKLTEKTISNIVSKAMTMIVIEITLANILVAGLEN